ncbi:MAG: PolC-type DNA polymerase III N-terminal domain-containing protein [Clostridia bacterium]
MTEKPFFEVFRTLEVDNQTRALFEQVVVTRVSTSPSQDVLRVYITSKKADCKKSAFS